MPKTVKAPVYTPHSQAYWASKFATPTEYLISQVGGGGKTAAPSKPVPIDLSKISDKHVKLQRDVALVGSAASGDSASLSRLKGLKITDLDPQVQTLAKQVQSLEATTGSHEDPSFLTRVFDILSRPMFATSNALMSRVKEEQKRNGSTDITDLNYVPIIGKEWWASLTEGEAMWRGLSGQDKTDPFQILDTAHPDMNPVAKGVLGFALSVAIDPTSYIGVGAVKSVGRAVGVQGAKIASNADHLANDLAKALSSADTANEVRAAVAKNFKESGILQEHLLADPTVMDLGNAADIKTFLTGGVGHRETAGVVSKMGRADRANQVRAVKAFLESTKKVLQVSTERQLYNEARAKAFQDGLLVDTSKMMPTTVVEFPTAKALTMSEKDVVIQLDSIKAERGRINQQKALPEYKNNPAFKAQVDEHYGHIEDMYKNLVDAHPLDLKDTNVKAALKFVQDNDPIYQRLTAESKALNARMVKKYGITPTEARLRVDEGIYPTDSPIAKMLNARDQIDLARGQRIGDRLAETLDDVHLPQGARKAKYSKYKQWKTVAGKYVEHYSSEMAALKATETTAAAAAEAGNTTGAVTAALAKGAHGPTSKKIDQALKDLTVELQARLHSGEMSSEELVAFLKENNIKDPSIIHDFQTMPPNVRDILNNGRVVRPDIKMIHNATSDAIAQAERNNLKVENALHAKTAEQAKAISEQTIATSMDLIASAMSLEARKALGLRLGFMGSGPQVASLAMPEIVSSLVNAAYKIPVVSDGIKAFNKALVSSAGLDKGIARTRAREAGRTTEVIARHAQRIKQTFMPFKPTERMTAWDNILSGKPSAFPEIDAAIHDELKLVADKFAPNAFPGLREQLSVQEVNMWIPTHGRLKDGQKNSAWSLNAGDAFDSQGDGVQWLVNMMRNSQIKGLDPAQIVWDLQIATEKAIARKATIETFVQQFGIHAGPVDKNLAARLNDPLAQRLVDEFGYRSHTLGDERFIFDPETARQFDKVQELFTSPKHLEVLGEYGGKITQAWKRIVTVDNPGFHVRNSFGDIFVSWLDGVQGIHGVQSHSMALRTIKRFRQLTDPNDPMIKAMGQPEMLDAYRGAKKAGATMPESHNTVLFKHHGKDITIGDLYAMYVNEGLLSGWANTEFAANFKKPGYSLAASKLGSAGSNLQQGILHFSEAREDVFRMAHFIDVIRKSPIKDLTTAAADAGARVRKFHFDYSDFTMTEKIIFARVFPFYKWTRKAFPLMVESLFAKPGKMSLYPKAQEAIGTAAGYDSMTPDVVTPEWIQARMLAPILSGDGKTTYAGVSLPYDALRSVGAPGDSLISMLNPFAKLALGAATNQNLGSNSSADFDLQKNLIGMFPQSNVANKQLSGTGTPEQLASFLTGVTLTQNNSKTIQSTLLDRKEAALDAKRKQQPAPK